MTTDRQQLLSGTEAPPDHLALDTNALGNYLARYIEGLGTDFKVEKFKGGQSNPTYCLTGGDGSSYVLRRRPPGELVATAHDVEREYKVISALAKVNYPVPTPYHLCSDESVIGSKFYVVSHCPGTVYWNNELPGVAPEHRGAIYQDMVARLAELHGLDYKGVGLGDLGKAGDYVARNFARWSKVYQHSRLVDIPDMDWLMKKLPELMPQDEQVRLLHGDFGLYNIIVDDAAMKVKVVLDWEMSTLGDPLVDLAHHCRAWWEPVDEIGGAASSLAGKDLKALGIPTLDEYIESYCRHMGLSEMPHRNFYLGYAQFRYGAMIQGILKRAEIGTASSRRVLQRQERVFEVAALARKTLEAI